MPSPQLPIGLRLPHRAAVPAEQHLPLRGILLQVVSGRIDHLRGEAAGLDEAGAQHLVAAHDLAQHPAEGRNVERS